MEDTFLAWPILCFGLFTALLAFICEYCVGRRAQKNVAEKGRTGTEKNKTLQQKRGPRKSWMSDEMVMQVQVSGPN